MAQWRLIDIFAGLAAPATRAANARRLAEALGAEEVLIFCADPEVDSVLPAPGFPQTLRDGVTWRAFLEDCERLGSHRTTLRSPLTGAEITGHGYWSVNGSFLVALSQREPDHELVSEAVALLPILSSAFTVERKAMGTEASESRLVECLDRASRLASEIDLARRELQSSYDLVQAAKQRSTFLSDASHRLSASLSLETVLGESACVVVPRLAAGCRFFLREEQGFRSRHSYPAATFDDSGISEILERLLEETIRTESLARHRDARTDLVLLPIRWRSRLNGALALVRRIDETGLFSAEDLVLFQDYAERLALHLENTFLYLEAQSGIRTRDEFLSIASHELKTPLTSILLSHQLVRRLLSEESENWPDGTAVSKLLRVIEEQLLSLRKLVDTLLDVSRIPLEKLSLEKVELDLSELVVRVAERFREQASHAGCPISLKVIYGKVSCDPIRIEQAVSNLITNAIKYGGKGAIEISVDVSSRHASVRVRDQGRGIGPEDQKRIFERFERAGNSRDISGLGLGLYVTLQIVESHGGSIHVESALGHGSSFEIRLPIG